MKFKSYCRQTIRQFINYAMIGLLTNMFGYILYLSLTYFWGKPKLTMTLLYLIGAIIGFLANRRFTFGHEGHVGPAAARYLLVQFSGYLLNLSMLIIFVDFMGFTHQVIQALAIVSVAIFLFVMLRVFVFAGSEGKKL